MELDVCGQAPHSKQFPADEAAALAALTVVVDKQSGGYAVIPVP